MPFIVLTYSDGTFITRAIGESNRCMNCGLGSCHHFVHVGTLSTTGLGVCCTLRCAERRVKRLGLK